MDKTLAELQKKQTANFVSGTISRNSSPSSWLREVNTIINNLQVLVKTINSTMPAQKSDAGSAQVNDMLPDNSVPQKPAIDVGQLAAVLLGVLDAMENSGKGKHPIGEVIANLPITVSETKGYLSMFLKQAGIT